MSPLKLFFQCWVCVLISIERGHCFYWIFKKGCGFCVLPSTHKGLKNEWCGGYRIPIPQESPLENAGERCLWSMWKKNGRDRERHAKSAQNPEMSPFSRPKAEEASSSRATNLLTCTDTCSCFFLTLSSPRSLLLPSLLRPPLLTPQNPVPRATAVWVYGGRIRTHSGVTMIQQ